MNHFFRTVVPLAGEGGRRPEGGGIQTQRLSRLAASLGCIATKKQKRG